MIVKSERTITFNEKRRLYYQETICNTTRLH